ncbi:MAG: DUF2927 domain-containing protein [Alphaproteobacteria bacterium]|nr:DUF2927 domain-containing protein [Alphaproteobacteria bacterium]
MAAPGVRLITGLLVLLLASAALTACRSTTFIHPPTPQQQLGLERLAQRFEKIAFFSEFSEGEHRLRKRMGPVTWHLTVTASGDAERALVRVLHRLSKLTGLSFTKAKMPERAVLDILIKPRPELIDHLLADGNTNQRFIYKTLCWGRMRGQVSGRIEHILVAIPNHLNAAEVETCLWIEITQGLGLPNDLEDLKPSIYSDAPYLTVGSLPWYDAILVQTLYDPRLQPGMSRSQAMPLARVILKELMAKRRNTAMAS